MTMQRSTGLRAPTLRAAVSRRPLAVSAAVKAIPMVCLDCGYIYDKVSMCPGDAAADM